jgi:predicted aldo/keto reductase-like oxidoreductase
MISSEKENNPRHKLPEHKVRRTGLKLPILGYGGAGIPTIWGNTLSVPDRIDLVRYAYDRGIRYFDTAGNYPESQEIIGHALKDVRGDVYLATKVETTVVEDVRKLVESSLQKFQTDYIDLLQIHGTPGLEQMSVKQAMKIHGELAKLRSEGITRHIGFSAHAYFDKALALISTEGFDQCMLAYGYLPKGLDQVFSARMMELRNLCIAKAHELGMCIVAMKVIAGGTLGAWSGGIVPEFGRERLNRLPGAAVRHVLNDGRFHILAIGMRLKEEIDTNINIIAGNTTYTPEDRKLLADFSVRAFERDPIKSMRIE